MHPLLVDCYHRIPTRLRAPIWRLVKRFRPAVISRHFESIGSVPTLSTRSVPIVESVSPEIVSALHLLTREIRRTGGRFDRSAAQSLEPLAQLPRRQLVDTQRRGGFWDLRGLQSAAHGERGIARFVIEQASAFQRVFGDDGFEFVFDDCSPVPRLLERFGETCQLRAMSELASGRNQRGIWYVTSPIELDWGVEELYPPTARGTADLVVTCYDLIPLKFSSQYLADPGIRFRYDQRLQLLREASMILCISQATADDVHELMGIARDRIVYIGGGVSPFFQPSASKPATLADLQNRFPTLQPDFVLLAGGMDFRKNIQRAFQAFGKLVKTRRLYTQLVVTFKVSDSERDQLARWARLAGIEKQVLITGYVSDDDLKALYQTAKLLVVPSLYEGYGLPIVEAYACHTPVVAGNNSSLIELVPDASRRFDAESVDDMARVIEAALKMPLPTPKEFAALLEPNTWEAVATRTRAAIEAVRLNPTQVRERRVAYITPMPPAQSGVADYCAALLPELRQFAEITVFTPDRLLSGDCLPLSTFDSVEQVEGSFDAVITQIGNSEFHCEVLDFLRAHPSRAVVEAHDVRMFGLYRTMFSRESVSFEDGCSDVLYRLYGSRYLTRLGSVDLGSPAALQRSGAWLFRELALLAKSVIVHNEYAASVVTRELPTAVVDVVPLAVNPSPAGSNTRKTDLIVSAGVIADSKNLDLLLEAVLLLRKSHPNLTVAVIGPGDLEMTRCGSADSLKALRKANAIVETGHVDAVEYARWLSEATVAVQLRATSNGESSAAVLDAISALTPLVVSHFSAVGLPKDVAVVADDTVKGLAHAIESLLDDSRLSGDIVSAQREFAATRTPRHIAQLTISCALRNGEAH